MAFKKPSPAATELDEVFTGVADYFSLLAEPTRLKILHSICNRERSVNDIAELTGLGQTTTSRHLNRLYQAKIVGRRREGMQVIYWVSNEEFRSICRTACVAVAAREKPENMDAIHQLVQDLAAPKTLHKAILITPKT